MNNRGKAKELTLGGCLLLIIAGIVALAMSGADSTGMLFWIGILFVVVGLIALLVLIYTWLR